ncbi:MAG: HAD-IIA family hydrolase [Actinomycetota bacterium]|nr:HAD-IIA family hydrolase [Actinomycetota bacterium]
MAGLIGIAWILDLDGVIWLADRPIAGSAEAIQHLDSAGQQILFVTNFSALTKRQAEMKLEACGIDAQDRVLTSAMAAASLVEAGERVLICAGDGVVEAVEDRGALALNPNDETISTDSIDAVIVGFHREFDFHRLAVSAQAIHDGARLISTNNDPTYPTPQGLLPGNGSLTAAVAAAGKTRATVAGKPHRPIAELALSWLEVERGSSGNIVVGDLPATDGLLAAEVGFDFGLVLSGVTSPEEATTCKPVPNFVADDLQSLVNLILDSE